MSPPVLGAAALLLKSWIHVTPQPARQRFVTLLLNRLLQGQPIGTQLAALSGKCFRLYVEDAQASFTFEVQGTSVRETALAPHVTIRGRAVEFLNLALRREDPDTLFFQRRLAVEGETETGLHLKNVLDAWDYDVAAQLRAILPPFLAQAAIGLRAKALGLRELIQQRRSRNHRNIRPAA